VPVDSVDCVNERSEAEIQPEGAALPRRGGDGAVSIGF